MIVLWFLPKTAGVRLAAAGWKSTVVAHVLGVTIGGGLIVWAEAIGYLNPAGAPPRDFWIVTANSPTPHMPLHEYLTAPFVALTIWIHSASTTRGWGIEHGITAVALLEASMLILALILMPYAAAGERAGLLFGRCLRLTWWSTTLLIPLGIGFMLDPIVRRWLDLPNKWVAFDYGRLALFGVWWLLVWLRSGFRYAGPPDGPAWQTRTPSCEGCGYAIVGIPVTNKCPECGRPVSESLPQRRCSPPFSDRLLGTRRLRAFWATCWAAVADRSFFDRLAVHRGHEDARSFFFAIACFIAVLVLLGSFIYSISGGATSHPDNNLWYGVVLASLSLLIEVSCASLIALIVAVVGRRGMLPAAVVSFWGLTALLPISCAGIISFMLIPLVSTIDVYCSNRWMVVAAGLLILTLLVMVVLLLVIGVRSIVRAVSATSRAQG